MDDLEVNDTDKDNLTLLNEILNAPASRDEFSREWTEVFGDVAPSGGSRVNPLVQQQERDMRTQQADFLPSNLLDVNPTALLDPTPVQGHTCFLRIYAVFFVSATLFYLLQESHLKRHPLLQPQLVTVHRREFRNPSRKRYVPSQKIWRLKLCNGLFILSIL